MIDFQSTKLYNFHYILHTLHSVFLRQGAVSFWLTHFASFIHSIYWPIQRCSQQNSSDKKQSSDNCKRCIQSRLILFNVVDLTTKKDITVVLVYIAIHVSVPLRGRKL